MLLESAKWKAKSDELERSDESRFWVKLFSKILKFHDRAYQIEGTLIDISLQKQLEKDLQYFFNLEKGALAPLLRKHILYLF